MGVVCIGGVWISLIAAAFGIRDIGGGFFGGLGGRAAAADDFSGVSGNIQGFGETGSGQQGQQHGRQNQDGDDLFVFEHGNAPLLVDFLCWLILVSLGQ